MVECIFNCLSVHGDKLRKLERIARAQKSFNTSVVIFATYTVFSSTVQSMKINNLKKEIEELKQKKGE